MSKTKLTRYAQLYNSAVKKRREISTENLQNENHLRISLGFLGNFQPTPPLTQGQLLLLT